MDFLLSKFETFTAQFSTASLTLLSVLISTAIIFNLAFATKLYNHYSKITYSKITYSKITRQPEDTIHHHAVSPPKRRSQRFKDN